MNEQGPERRGRTKNEILVDRALAQDYNTRLINQGDVWIDYNNDSMPNTWILECVQLYKINRIPSALIRNSEQAYRPASSQLQCGIDQGNSLSLVLFCIGLNPLS